MKDENWEQFGKTATILGFVADCIALSLLLFSSLPASPDIDNQVWVVFQYTILSLSIISYLGYLRKTWREDYKSNPMTFSQYLVDLLKLDEWQKLIPPIIMLCFLAIITVQDRSFFNLLFWAVIILGITKPYFVFKKEQEQANSESERQNAYANLSTWTPRIENYLKQKFYVTSLTMSH